MPSHPPGEEGAREREREWEGGKGRGRVWMSCRCFLRDCLCDCLPRRHTHYEGHTRERGLSSRRRHRPSRGKKLKKNRSQDGPGGRGPNNCRLGSSRSSRDGMSPGPRERERERGRERASERETATETERDKETKRQRDRETERQRDREGGRKRQARRRLSARDLREAQSPGGPRGRGLDRWWRSRREATPSRLLRVILSESSCPSCFNSPAARVATAPSSRAGALVTQASVCAGLVRGRVRTRPSPHVRVLSSESSHPSRRAKRSSRSSSRMSAPPHPPRRPSPYPAHTIPRALPAGGDERKRLSPPPRPCRSRRPAAGASKRAAGPQGAARTTILIFKLHYRALEQAPHSTWPLDWRIYRATDAADFSRASVSSFHLPDSLAAISLPMAALQAWMNLMRFLGSC